jgi:hypothetical protein
MDIQSMLNHGNYSAEQYLEWAYQGIIKYQEDLFKRQTNQIGLMILMKSM